MIALQTQLETERVSEGRITPALLTALRDAERERTAENPNFIAKTDAEQREAIKGQPIAQLLKRPEITITHALLLLADAGPYAGALDARLKNEARAVETEIKYAGYLDQQRRSIEKLKRAEERAIPIDFIYKGVAGLSREMQEKLERVRPQTVGQASRIPGVTPAALTLINVLVEAHTRQKTA